MYRIWNIHLALWDIYQMLWQESSWKYKCLLFFSSLPCIAPTELEWEGSQLKHREKESVFSFSASKISSWSQIRNNNFESQSFWYARVKFLKKEKAIKKQKRESLRGRRAEHSCQNKGLKRGWRKTRLPRSTATPKADRVDAVQADSGWNILPQE